MIFLFYETMTLDMVKTTKQQEHTDWVKRRQNVDGQNTNFKEVTW